MRTEIAVLLSMVWTVSVHAATFESVMSGDWDDGATWGNDSPGNEGVDWPGSADSAIIEPPDVVVVDGSDVEVAQLTIQDGLVAGGVLRIQDGGSIEIESDLSVEAQSSGIGRVEFAGTAEDPGTLRLANSVRVDGKVSVVGPAGGLITGVAATDTLHLATSSIVDAPQGPLSIAVRTEADGTIRVNGPYLVRILGYGVVEDSEGRWEITAIGGVLDVGVNMDITRTESRMLIEAGELRLQADVDFAGGLRMTGGAIRAVGSIAAVKTLTVTGAYSE
jgi:hypothetical protein